MAERKRILLNEESSEFKALKESWFEYAEKIETPEQLKAFAEHLFYDYVHDYGTVVRAVSALAIAGACMGANIEGITGFQAGFVVWDFIKYWEFKHNKCGLKLIDYDNMLYPQYADVFEKKISQSVWKHLQSEARKEYEGVKDHKCVSDSVVEHWKSIVDGNVPFGYTVREEE